MSVAALVDFLVSSGKASSNDDALGRLALEGWGSYGSLKQKYFQVFSEERFRAVLVSHESGFRAANDGEMEQILSANRRDMQR
jgi:hypothetical protein